MAKCKFEKPCYHCKKKDSYHRSLCPKLFKEKRPPSNSVFTANTAPPLVEDCSEGQSMFPAGEQVIMQTALIEAMNLVSQNQKLREFLWTLVVKGHILLKKSLKN